MFATSKENIPRTRDIQLKIKILIYNKKQYIARKNKKQKNRLIYVLKT